MEGRLAPLRIRQEDKKRETPDPKGPSRRSRYAVVDAGHPAARALRRNEVPFNYLVMCAAVLAATLLRIFLQPLLGLDYPFATYTIAVIVVSGLSGMRPGLMAALLGAGIGIAVFARPDVLFTPSGVVGIGVYCASSIAVATICGSVRSARKQAERAAGIAREGQRRLEREVEARELAQDAAREANDRTTKLLDRMAEAMLTLDLDWTVLYANENALALLPKERDSIEGRRLWEVLNSELQGELMSHLENACTSGLPIRFDLADAQGRHWTEYRAYPTPDGLTLFARDITEEKRTRVALEESEERYRAFLAQSSESIWRFELERPIPTDLPISEQIDAFYQFGYLAECNDTMARQYGYRSAAEIIGKRLGELLPRSDGRSVDYLRTFIRSRFRLVGAESFEMDRAGRRHIYLNNLLGIEENGLLIRAWGTQRDITEQKKAEAAVKKLNAELEVRVEERTLELRSANRELEAFCYSVSHDLRAPLRSLMSQSNILIEDYATRLDEEGVAALSRLATAAKNMANTIDDLLELSKLQRTEMRKEAVDVTELAEFIAQELRSRDICTDTSFKIQPGLTTVADKGLLQVALVNLMENACKFACKSDKPLIEIGMREVDGETAFFVKDNGVGFDMKYVDKIFRPFERLHRAEDYPGTGIGLANVERVIERHGGRVWAEGAVGQGATFYFTL